MAITGRAALWALLGAGFVAVVMPSWTGIAAACSALFVGVLGDLTLAGGVRTLSFTRSGPTSVRLGGQVEVTLTVTNPGTRTVKGVLRDSWQPSAGAHQTRHRIDIGPGESQRVVTVLEPTRRGDREAHRVTVRSVGPLGLAARQGSHDVPWTVRALPPFTSRKHLPTRLARLRELDGRQAVLVRGEGTEFDSLREYVAGDDIRSIDWRATARASEVMVRTWRPERDRHIVIVVDTGRTSAGRVGDAPRLDAALDSALLLAALAGRAGDRVDLIAYDRRTRASVSGASGRELLPALVHAMAPLEPELIEADARGMVSEVLRRTSRRALVVMITGLDPAPLEAGLLPVLPALTSRHQVLLAAIGDPRVAEMARGRGDAHAVYDAAAAERSLADRRRITSLLTGRGVVVVDETPEELPAALADSYLALKAAGAL